MTHQAIFIVQIIESRKHMARGKKTGGRVKGVPNKLTTGAKEVIAQVAENIGGVARMTKWARESPENEKAFWTNIYTKLLPLQASVDMRARVTSTFTWRPVGWVDKGEDDGA